MRPYFKFTLPTLDICEAEKQAWDSAARDAMEISQVHSNSKILNFINIDFSDLVGLVA